jgi:hypothetical protein
MNLRILLLAALLSPLFAVAADPEPAAAAPPTRPQPLPPPDFGWFADLVGSCWLGTLPEGREHKHCYVRQFDRFIRGVATLSMETDGSRKPVFIGDSVFAADNQKHIVYYSWGSDGGHRQLTAHYAGDELVFPITLRANPRKVVYRSVWKRIDKDTFEVRREKPDADEKKWTEELKVTYRRAPAADPKAN